MVSSIVARGVALGGVGAVVVIACSTPTPPPAAAPSGFAPAAAPPPATAPHLAPSTSGGPSGSSPPPVRMPHRTSTPGRIACETTDCDLASEVCCVVAQGDGSTVGMCAPRPSVDGANACCPSAAGFCSDTGLTTERGCDETADCASGTRCCELDRGEGALARHSCSDSCAVETCLAGSTCANGNRCVSEGDASMGSCSLQIAPPTCGAVTCEADQVCCWNPERRGARCAAECEEGDRPFHCTSPDQCDRAPCDVYPGSSVYDCGGGGFQGGVLCRTTRDCPEQLSAFGAYPGGPTLRACKHTADLPPGVKGCVYE